MNKKCSICGSTMVEKSTRKIGKTTYHVLFCESCKHQVARSEE